MNKLTFNELSKKNIKRCNSAFHPLDSWTPTDWATALAGETGEACNFIKKLRRFEDGEDKPYNKGLKREVLIKSAGKELADVVFYADLLAQRLGLNLGDLVVDKFNEVSDRVGSKIKL